MALDIVLHKEILASLHARGVTLSEIADALGKSPAAVSLTCQGKSISKDIQAEIARRLERRPEDIWPERYVTKEEKR